MKCLRCEACQSQWEDNCPHCNYPGYDSRSMLDLIPMGYAKGMLIGLGLSAALGTAVLLVKFAMWKWGEHGWL